MLTPEEFRYMLEDTGTLELDGGLATELETRGYDLNHPLWSAKLLKDNPEAIQNVHRDYYLAGANVAITASYQSSVDGFRAHFGMSEAESVQLIKRSVALAHSAREMAHRQSLEFSSRVRLVAGSVGCYGAYLSDGSEYSGDYKLRTEQFKAFHRPRIRALVEAGVDLLALETMPQLTEIESLLEMLREEFAGVSAWVSCTLVDSGHISDGTCIEQVLRVVNQSQDVVVAFGVNCVPIGLVSEALRLMRRRTKLPLLCYPNSGEVFDAQTKTWSSGEDAVSDWTTLAHEWKEHGARLIGGCCRTGPKQIMAISRALSAKTENSSSDAQG